MKEILGYFLFAQAIITGIIVYSIAQLSDSIKASATHLVSKDVSLSKICFIFANYCRWNVT
ncbi:hypothetical protein ACQJ0Y_25365 [Peribacillus simplex]|uniref:hypothetical protein n=1 Tax=Peribacillus simplex TaxID=1478 RepID=UPI003CF7F551